MSFLLKNFEKETGILAKDITEAKMAKILINESFKHFFQNPHQAVSLVSEIIENITDPEIKKELTTVLVNFQLLENEALIADLYYKNNDDETIKKTILQYLDSEDPLLSLTAFVCSSLTFPDIDFSDKQEKLKKGIDEVGEIFKTLGKLENSFTVRDDLIDLVNNVCTTYFMLYNYSLDPEWLEKEKNIVNEYEMSIFQNDEDNENEILSIKPEDLGFIDITKLKNI